jgi:transcriptional regulator with XRE-family HTH domain
MIDPVALGRRVKHLRELKGWSLGGLAEAASLSKSYLAKLERGDVENPGLQTLQAIAAALGATLADFLMAPSGDAPPPASSRSEVAEYERLLANLPPGLKGFIEEKERAGERVPADAIRSMASIQFRGKRPESVADWRFLYDAINRSL